MIREITIQFWIVIQKVKKNKNEWTIWGLTSILLLSINLKLMSFHNLVPFYHFTWQMTLFLNTKSPNHQGRKKPSGSSPFSHILAKGWLAPCPTGSGPRLWGLWGWHCSLRAEAVYLEFWHGLQERTAFRFPSTDFFFPKHRQWLGLKATKLTEWRKLRSCKQEMIAKPMPGVWPMQTSTSSQLLTVNLNGVFPRCFQGIMEFYFSIRTLAKGIFG